MDKLQDTSSKNNSFRIFKFVVLGLALAGVGLYNLKPVLDSYYEDVQPASGQCPIYAKVAPASFDKSDNSSTVFKIIRSPEYRELSAAKLSGAVQVDTQIGDVWPSPQEDPERWAKFGNFHKYLEETFPTVYENLKVETVNTWGLVYTWEGSDKSLKPSMYTAHQDTVPVQAETIGDWSYPPLSGHFDGTTIFGRGASDCKNNLIAIMESVELLLADGFQPKRTIVLAFGFDEEASGRQGAKQLGLFLDERYGKDGIYSIIDEGTGIIQEGDLLFAVPTVREKGYMDVSIQLTTPGGHSSLPPDHTSIGIMAQLIDLIENDQWERYLGSDNPILTFLQCQSEHSDAIPANVQKAILKAKYDDKANTEVIEFLQGNRVYKYDVQTSQSIDIIHGGAKANALPENTQIIVNHRVAIQLQGKDVHDRMVKRVSKIAEKNGLGVIGFSGESIVEPTAAGFFNLTVYGGDWLEPSPVTPSEGKIWDLIAGTTRHVIEDIALPDRESPVVVSPFLVSGNTDTRYYWNLTKNIFRYSPCVMDVNFGHVHSVDEYIPMDSHLQAVAFFYEFMQSIDA